MDMECKIDFFDMMFIMCNQFCFYLNIVNLDLGFIGVVFKDFLGGNFFSLSGMNDFDFF